MINLFLATCIAAASYFIVALFIARKRLRNMTSIERAAVQRQDEEDAFNSIFSRRHKGSRGKIALNGVQKFFVRRGYNGTMVPALTAVIVLYLVVALLLRFLGADGIIGPILAIPGVIGVVAGAAAYVSRGKRRKFNVQLLEFLKLVASQVEGGNGPMNAIERVVPALQEPIRAEMARTVEVARTRKDLVSAMQDLELRFPSKALKMFIVALEIDRDKGGRIEPALTQAARTLQRDFDLTQEAAAQLSQAKGEFYIIQGIVIFIGVLMFKSGGDSAADAYTSPLGIIALGLVFLNMAIGFYRGLKVFRKARGE